MKKFITLTFALFCCLFASAQAFPVPDVKHDSITIVYTTVVNDTIDFDPQYRYLVLQVMPGGGPNSYPTDRIMATQPSTKYRWDSLALDWYDHHHHLSDIYSYALVKSIRWEMLLHHPILFSKTVGYTVPNGTLVALVVLCFPEPQ